MFSQFYTNLNESATLGLTKKVRALKAMGKDVIGLTLGEPDFNTPDHIKAAAQKAMEENFTHYTPVAGIPDLRQAVVDKLKRENGLTYSMENVIVSTGAKQSLFNVFNTLTNPGDEVIIPTPCWVSYREILQIARAKIIEIECSIEEEFKITPQKLQGIINQNTKLIIFSSPSNPTGSIYSYEELAALVDFFKDYPNLYIVADEIYEHIAFGKKHISIASFPEVYDRTVIINGFSKGFAMTGWRLGYLACANKELVYLCEKIQGQVTSGPNSIAQKAGVAALNGDMSSVAVMCAEFERRRDRMFLQLKEIKDMRVILPDGAFYFYPDISAYFGRKTSEGNVIENSDALCMYLIDSGVAVIPGSAFGTSNHIRLSFAYSQDVLDEGIKRLKAALEALV